jgi:CubicO group peptidase (beta-lactamase class C family)
MVDRNGIDRRSCLLFLGGAVSACANAVRGPVQDASMPAPQLDLDGFLDEAARSYGTIGHSVAVLRRGRLVYARHAGLADREAALPISARSIYPIFSVSKLFLAVELLGCVERGEVDLDMQVSRIRSSLPVSWHPVTLRELLAHVSGLPDYMPDHIAGTADAAIDAIRNLPLRFQPGSRNDYNQTNFLLAREALERATGRTLTALTADQFRRADMRRTGYGLGQGINRDIVKSYRPAPDRAQPAVLYPVPQWPDYTFGSSGAVTTLGDLVSWTQALLSGELLPSPALSRSWRPHHLTSGNAAWHTHGWNYASHDGVVVVGHAGSDRVVWRHTFRAADPSDNATAIYLDNGGRTGLVPARIASSVIERVMPGTMRSAEALEEMLLQRLSAGDWLQALMALDRDWVWLDAQTMERTINRVGYDALSTLGADAALHPFRLNVARFPMSSNAHDSLGEAYLAAGDLGAARASYRSALELDPSNERIPAILAEMEIQRAKQ